MIKNEVYKKQVVFKLLMSLGIAFMIGLLFYYGFLKSIENMSEDTLYQTAGTIPEDIKIIAIDEQTLSKLGPYSQWDRNCFAKLIEILNENEEMAPKVIGFDIIFSGSNDSGADIRLVEIAKNMIIWLLLRL